MTIDKDHKERVRAALKEHDTNFLYAYAHNKETPGDKESVIEFAIEEVVDCCDRDDKGSAEKILLSVVHSGITADEMGIALYRAGYDKGLEEGRKG